MDALRRRSSDVDQADGMLTSDIDAWWRCARTRAVSAFLRPEFLMPYSDRPIECVHFTAGDVPELKELE
jgi:hypothetical protein